MVLLLSIQDSFSRRSSGRCAVALLNNADPVQMLTINILSTLPQTPPTNPLGRGAEGKGDGFGPVRK